MTSDEMIRKVAEVLTAHPSIPNYRKDLTDRDYVCPTCGAIALVYGPNSPDHALHQAEQLAEAGLLAPTPLRHEEWDVLIDDRYYANIGDKTRDTAEGMVRRGYGKLVHRYSTDWLPVDRAEGDGNA